MSSLVLKIIAYVTMLIDHIGVLIMGLGLRGQSEIWNTVYYIFRCIGRVAFPLFCFMLVQGAIHTKNKWKYLLRIFIFAIVSEIPFDYLVSHRFFYFEKQNVGWELMIGLLLIYLLQFAMSFPEKKKRILGFLLYCIAVITGGILASFVIHSDYGYSGIAMIAVMGALVLPWEELKPGLSLNPNLITAVSVAGIAACAYFSGGTEWYALAAAPVIYFYNHHTGMEKASKAAKRTVKVLMYSFYPVHLAALMLVLIIQKIYK